MAFLPQLDWGAMRANRHKRHVGEVGRALKLCGWLLLVHTPSLNPQVVECQSREGACKPPPSRSFCFDQLCLGSPAGSPQTARGCC